MITLRVDNITLTFDKLVILQSARFVAIRCLHSRIGSVLLRCSRCSNDCSIRNRGGGSCPRYSQTSLVNHNKKQFQKASARMPHSRKSCEWLAFLFSDAPNICQAPALHGFAPLFISVLLYTFCAAARSWHRCRRPGSCGPWPESPRPPGTSGRPLHSPGSWALADSPPHGSGGSD